MPKRSAASSQDVEAILFDLDETLIYEERLVDAAFAEVGAYAAHLVGKIDADEFAKTARSLARTYWRQSPMYKRCNELGISSEEGLWATFERKSRADDFRHNCYAYRTMTWESALEEWGRKDERLARQLSDYFIETRRKSCATLYPHVKETLRRLSRHYRLGIVTNGPACLQHEKLDRSGIKGMFQCTVVSAEQGVGKPSHEIFALAAEHLKTSLSRLVMVGDSQERDVEGAKRAGVRVTVLVDQGASPYRRQGSDPLPTSATVRTVNDLPRLLNLA